MKGFVLSMDALIAISLVLLVTSSMGILTFSHESPEVEYERLYYIGKDILNIIQKLQIYQIQDMQPVQDLINEGFIKPNDMNKTLLELIGTLWASENITEAQDIATDILDSVLNSTPNSFELVIGNESIYLKNSTNVNFISRLSTIASGFEVGKPISGYVSRASAVEVMKNNTLVVMGDVISSSVKKPPAGTNQNDVNVTYVINIPENATITEVRAFIENAWLDTKFDAYVNGQNIPGTEGLIGNAKLENDTLYSYFQPGNNTANVLSRYSGGAENGEGGDDGATHWIVKYNVTEFETHSLPDKFYFQEVTSECSIRYKKPLFVMGNITSMNIHIEFPEDTQINESTLKFLWRGNETLISKKVLTTNYVEWSNAEILSVLNSIGVTYQEISNEFYWFVLDVDEYHQLEDIDYVRKILGNASYVEVEYDPVIVPFGYIDLTTDIEAENFTDEDTISDFFRYLRWEFDIPPQSIPLEARWQYAWVYHEGADPSQIAQSNSVVLYNHTSAEPYSDPFIKEFVRFGYNTQTVTGALINGTNRFELNFTDGYGINPYRSLGAVTILINSNVGYGDVFINSSAAIDDAVNRLNNVLGEFVDATNIISDSVSISNVPSLWGPVELEIRVWK